MAEIDRTQGLVGNVGLKAPCRVASTANLTLSGEQTIDGVAAVTGDRVLVKDQTTGTQNGIYVVDTGDWNRAQDADGNYDFVEGTLVKVNNGTLGQGFWYISTTGDIVIDSTSITWARASTVLAVVSAFMQTMLDDASALAARTTLGVGTGDSPTFTGVTTTGAVSVGTTLGVTGATTLTGALTANGNVVLGDLATDTLRMTNDTFVNSAAGIVGVGVTPSAHTAGKSIELATVGCGISGYSSGTYINQNLYNVGGVQYFAATGTASQITLSAGVISGLASASGTGGTSAAATLYSMFETSSTVSANGQNAAAACVDVYKDNGTSRSINAAGTVNASGADYAEYELKASDCPSVAKGQIVGFDSDGRITHLWARAKSFGVKSTDPSLVGGDSWGSEDALGMKEPKRKERAEPQPIKAEKKEDFEQRQRKHKLDLEADEAEFELAKERFNARLEAARQKVDRIAYSGKVPVNVQGAAVGDYIVPAQDGDGIKGIAVAAPTFEQYRIAVGQVRKILPDGRALIAVKVG